MAKNKKARRVCPFVNRTCAGALQRVLEYDLGVTDTEPEPSDYKIVANFARNLSFIINKADMPKGEKLDKQQEGVVNRYKVVLEELTQEVGAQ